MGRLSPVLIDVDERGDVRMWSRHGTGLTARLGALPDRFACVPPGTVFDGELVAIGERGGQAVQDFAAVTRAIFTGDPLATERPSFVAFDVLRLAGENLRARPWHERRDHLHQALPVDDRVRLISSQPATPEAHAAIVALGFEGHRAQAPRAASSSTSVASSAERA